MARVRYNLEQRVFIYDCYVKSNSYKSCRRKFRLEFPDTTRLSLFCSVRRESGILTALYTMDTGAVSPDVRLPEREDDHEPPSSVEVNNTRAIPPIPHMFSWLGT
jgi:hypothetical protein